jgi:hypothetical protein
MVIWQLFCSAVMLLIDYPPKYQLYERLMSNYRPLKNQNF